MFRCLKCCTLVSTVHWLGWVLTDCYSHAEYCYSQVATAWRRSKGYSVLQTGVTESHRVTDCHEPRPVNSEHSPWLTALSRTERTSHHQAELLLLWAGASWGLWDEQTSPWWERGNIQYVSSGSSYKCVNVCKFFKTLLRIAVSCKSNHRLG